MSTYQERELPTRPDAPAASRRCKHCGKAYGDHAQTSAPQNTKAECQGIRKLYERDEGADDVR